MPALASDDQGHQPAKPAPLLDVVLDGLGSNLEGRRLMLSKRDTGFKVLFVTVLLLIPVVLTLTMSRPANAQQVLIIRLEDIGNNANKNLGISPDTHHCVATGWSAKWDINEDFDAPQHVWTNVQSTEEGERWFVRVVFNNDDPQAENPDVDVVCFAVSIAEFRGDKTLYDPD
jgi:hypothetical protein